MQKKWLISWIGETDHKAAEGTLRDGVGPVANALMDSSVKYDCIHLLTNYPHERSVQFCDWLEQKTGYVAVNLQDVHLAGPTHYADIYLQVSQFLTELKLPKDNIELTFHLSPGTPAMAVIWIMLAKTRFPASLIQSLQSKLDDGTVTFGIEKVDFPFDLASDFLPEFLQRSDQRIERLAAAPLSHAPEFAKIIHCSAMMQEQIDLSRRVAIHNVPILILGETGTGKELFATAIHEASRRKAQAFIAVNCGAIPKELVNSELFGHKKGAFTGADSARKGHFREADGGTLFLDEIGDLPLDAQVRLLRALQEGQITPVGETNPIKVDVRIIAATHRDLMAEVAAGRFREDLFHRLAVGIIHLPPLRDRSEDIELLIEHSLARINNDSRDLPEWQNKIISVGAKNILLSHSWPGNVRELYHTLLRAAIWSRQAEITAADISRNLLQMPASTNQILDQPLHKGFDLQALLDQVERHYLQRAIKKSAGKKKQAAEYLNISNYQTLSNRMEKLGISSGEQAE
ncbi:sigma-54 interaction domain-containing protein [Iodobacter ciconiae]|uniref:Sigma-54-dependent Fis family transcriptional regulator n=1 Tax=Iodobacter ciconiae TaxID=2496266 RepID=A0A3S8ZPU5_9NEIS|nr:RNA repair transcriptional activator RtcR family protein [Iodobacter ciconiae]AZN35488.1 sigma-54-dependent Fis family transcriptional regulator [Iodobacter ciconiae]